MKGIKRNERDWAGQLISWIKEAITSGATVFQDVTNDTGVRLANGRTKFPDILLFTDRISGIIFNGWELKFPDTPVDDPGMLNNALEKARDLGSSSFVTWNGAEAVLWGIDTSDYSLQSLNKIKVYHKEPQITHRADLADPALYMANEGALRRRCLEILHDLDILYLNGELKPAIDISGTVIDAIGAAAAVIIPQFRQAIDAAKANSAAFRREFNLWKIYESSTLNILSSSSRRKEHVCPELVLAKFTFYNLVGRLIFYLTLSENLSGELGPVKLAEGDVKGQLDNYFAEAKAIDYQAIFKPYFTDPLPYSPLTEQALASLIKLLTSFDFRVLPPAVTGNILANLVPPSEKQKFGQYFTPEPLATLVAASAVRTCHDTLLDPTSGTGTFLNAFYDLLGHFGCTTHTDKLSHIWGNDVSHFPAILSVINLYRHAPAQTDNFPRVLREDFFSLSPGSPCRFPDPRNHRAHINEPVPLFDGIASNFPFIQQEEIPSKQLSSLLQASLGATQPSLTAKGKFCINARSDYFTYCIYHTLKFLKPGGRLAAVTSNAWLGKEYGMQLKRFLLDNFHIKYIVRSEAEHWFHDSQVSTIFFVLEKGAHTGPTRFVTLHARLENLFPYERRLELIEDFYADLDNCDNPGNKSWERDLLTPALLNRKDGAVTVCTVPRASLQQDVAQNGNWSKFFFSPDLFAPFKACFTSYYPLVANVFRGERTGWNDMFVIDSKEASTTNINPAFLHPYIKSSSELNGVSFGNAFNHYLFVCTIPFQSLDKGTQGWITKFQDRPNTNGSKTVPQACASHRPYWYSLDPKKADIVTSINPNERWFFTYSSTPFATDQRLIAIQVQPGYDKELIAALLNSAVTYLALEMRGTPRNLGALDLNATYLKQLHTWDPSLLSADDVKSIKNAFIPLSLRPALPVAQELARQDRRNFDITVLRAYGLNASLLTGIYELLTFCVNNRVAMHKR